jgi:pimeloyl-ACP methyl ester carboxylesterase
VVSLSGERILGAQRDLLVDARRLRVPVLWVSSENDGYTKFAAARRRAASCRRSHASSVATDGALHGRRYALGQRSSVQPISQNASS